MKYDIEHMKSEIYARYVYKKHDKWYKGNKTLVYNTLCFKL